MVPYILLLIFEMISQKKSLPQAMNGMALFDPDSDIDIHIRFDRSTMPESKPDLGLFVNDQIDYSNEQDQALILAIIENDAAVLIAEHPQVADLVNFAKLNYLVDNMDVTWR